MAALQHFCRGTVVDIQVGPLYNGALPDPQYSQFERVFWSFPQCIHAVDHCKPFVSVDGTHLYG
ncbi:hypothetical protein PIB30_115863, partial [Stylosanthes scabra]|nr:hypothetical protein [Stylosanthes scabra]